MPQDILERLLSTAENRVCSKQGTDCMICLEDYDTLNTSTGVVEWEIRLPCGHGLGSSCILTWLRTNNSCPACRSTVFPLQPRPHLENGTIGVDRASRATVPAPTRRVIPTASTAPVPTPRRRVIPTARPAPVPTTTTDRAVKIDLTALIPRSVPEFAIVFAAAALVFRAYSRESLGGMT